MIGGVSLRPGRWGMMSRPGRWGMMSRLGEVGHDVKAEGGGA